MQAERESTQLSDQIIPNSTPQDSEEIEDLSHVEEEDQALDQHHELRLIFFKFASYLGFSFTS